ncbi:MAG: pyrimidine/purine nucleoside phosphorylase [Planctomycetes bacterium]|nr:pyrimidine/purine nucleoside phosphorylase [Planctomycetota bacterium]
MLQHNAYFENNVQSVAFERHGRKASVGAIIPGSYHFGTDAAERMSIVSGECHVQRDGSDDVIPYAAGTSFEVTANSGFTVSCTDALAYLCEYL